VLSHLATPGDIQFPRRRYVFTFA